MPGYSISDAVHYALQQLPKTVPLNINFAFDGKAQEYLDSQGNLTGIFVMAFIFIYLVLSAQFGSFIDTFIIFSDWWWYVKSLFRNWFSDFNWYD